MKRLKQDKKTQVENIIQYFNGEKDTVDSIFDTGTLPRRK